jgi:hypothetical protein
VAEAGGVVDEGMELAVFAAGIDLRGQVGEELGVEVAAGEFGGEDARVDAGDFGAEAGGDHGAGERGGGDLPYGKDGFETGAGELLFAISADVGEEEIAECHGLNGLGGRALAEGGHAGFVLFVGAGPGEGNGPEGKAEGFGLQFEKLSADGVHGDAVELFVEGGEKRDDFDGRVLAEEVQGPGAIFTAGPGEGYTFQAATATRSFVATVRLSQAYKPKRTAV